MGDPLFLELGATTKPLFGVVQIMLIKKNMSCNSKREDSTFIRNRVSHKTEKNDFLTAAINS